MAKTTKKVEVEKAPKVKVCENCKGTGRVAVTPIATGSCNACQGTGVIK